MNEMYNRQGLEHSAKLVDVESKIEATRALICGKLSEMQIRLNCVQLNEISKNNYPFSVVYFYMPFHHSTGMGRCIYKCLGGG